MEALVVPLGVLVQVKTPRFVRASKKVTHTGTLPADDVFWGAGGGEGKKSRRRAERVTVQTLVHPPIRLTTDKAYYTSMYVPRYLGMYTTHCLQESSRRSGPREGGGEKP